MILQKVFLVTLEMTLQTLQCAWRKTSVKQALMFG